MMTHEQVIAVLQAHKEGKPLEYYNLLLNSWHTVKEEGLTEVLTGMSRGQSYRIAPEPPKPEYVPFESMEEFMPHRNKWFKLKAKTIIMQITGIGDNGIMIGVEYFSWENAFLTLTFEDGTPCGKLVEK